MPVPQLPVELIKLIVDVPTLAKADLRSLNSTARVFPPLVRRRLFRRLIIRMGWIQADKMSTSATGERYAITLHEMDRLMAFRRHPDLAALVRQVWLSGFSELKAPPWSIPMTAHDLMQLVYAIFPRLEGAISLHGGPSIAPPRLDLPCCQTLHTIRSLAFDTGTWTSLQACTGLRHLGIEEMELHRPLPVVPTSLPFRLKTLVINMIYGKDVDDVFLMPFLRACGPTLQRLSLGINFDDVRDLSMLPKLATLSVEMESYDNVDEFGETLDEWLATILPTCQALEHLLIGSLEAGYELHHRTPASLLAVPKVAAALPATLKRIDFDMPPREGQLEAALSKNKSVQVIGMPTEEGDSPWLEFCRQRGITVVDPDMDPWSA